MLTHTCTHAHACTQTHKMDITYAHQKCNVKCFTLVHLPATSNLTKLDALATLFFAVQIYFPESEVWIFFIVSCLSVVKLNLRSTKKVVFRFDQWMTGLGFPVAGHLKLTEAPFSTMIPPPTAILTCSVEEKNVILRFDFLITGGSTWKILKSSLIDSLQ